jgi:alkylation response protein AidB-like acyl-CoA dehydrogenase
MRFAFEEQQVEFRAQLRTLLERECTAADLRNSFDLALSESAPDRRRWEQLASMGVVGLTVPEREGGLGLGAVDLVGLLEEAGRAGLPEPLSETAALVVPFLVDIVAEQDGEADQADESAGEAAGSEAREKARQWLRRIAAGEAIATVVCDVASPAGPVVPAARADPAGPGVWAGVADVVVVFAPGRIVLLPGARSTRPGFLRR